MKYVIWDLDNCLADDAWRIPRINWNTKNPTLRYAGYHAACESDKPGNIDVYRSAVVACVPAFLTARPEIVRNQTLRWLRRHLNATDPVLLMRPEGNQRRAVHVKERQLLDLCESFPESVECAYDDRQEIVDMYRAHGIQAHQLAIHGVDAYTQPKLEITFIEPLAATAEEEEALAALASKRLGAPASAPITAADVLAKMADTYRERNAVYGSNYLMVAQLMKVLFPAGVPSELVVQDHFHLFELVLVKLSRFAISNLTHIDSAHDAAVYFAMCESILHNSKETK